MEQKVQREDKAQAGIVSTLVCVTWGRRIGGKRVLEDYLCNVFPHELK